MQLKECEKQLEDITEQINILLREREEILIEWHKAFDAENVQDVKCVYEKNPSGYSIILINGESRLVASEVWDMNFAEDLDTYYKQVDHGIHKRQILNKRNDDLTEWQRNLIYAKAAELRKKIVGYE